PLPRERKGTRTCALHRAVPHARLHASSRIRRLPGGGGRQSQGEVAAIHLAGEPGRHELVEKVLDVPGGEVRSGRAVTRRIRRTPRLLYCRAVLAGEVDPRLRLFELILGGLG